MASAHVWAPGPFQKANRSAFVNFLQAKYEMFTGAVTVGSYPYHLLVEASDVCQLRCPTCVTGIENELKRRKDGHELTFRQERTKLTPELFGMLLDEVGEYLFMVLFYNFGEPLLNQHLPELLRMAKARRIETDVHTNLSLPLSDARIEEILVSGVDFISASVDGFSQETYEKHRVGGNLALVKDNLERLARTRDRLGLKTSITYNLLVFAFNEHETGDAQRYCDDIGITFNVREAFVHDPTWLPSYRRAEAAEPVPDDVALPEGFSHVQQGTRVAWSPLTLFPSRSRERCSWHYGYSVVSAGGAVSPCCGVPSEQHDFGRFGPGRGRFADVWNNSRLQASRAAFAGTRVGDLAEVETICTRCPMHPFMLELYSLHDFKVVANFCASVDSADPVLTEAFDLFTRARYGISMGELLPNGQFALPPRFFNCESADGARQFVDFFQAALGSSTHDHA